ncbi:DNA-directed RNA polymerase [Paenibacillus sp. SC116]|uniref:DNA-directed RNA polymerase n=1 Tax=Paenibacillus sp. SC116 TaxID=2968986 RepID=UPI00215AEF3F|nr:DNA-directed RNA polymerase [Paenibacillus sp. SC116]MCR8842996.1 DNA-directed RNA polymerase [Paenibacillus sp. SC116]
MRVTTFLTGLSIGALAGIYLADRRSFEQLQSKLQTAGDVVNDVVGKAKNQVVETALESLAQGSSTVGSTLAKTSQVLTNAVSKEHHTPRLDQIKELIDRDPEVRRQVDAILRESGASHAISASETHVPAVVAEAAKSSHKTSAHHQSSH